MPDVLAGVYRVPYFFSIFRDMFTLQVHEIFHFIPALFDNERLCIYLLLLCK